MFTDATNKFEVMNGLADIDGFKICIQVCVWLGFPSLTLEIWNLSERIYESCLYIIVPFP